MLSIVRRASFEACHRLPRYEGNCSRWHGHSYKLEVSITGTPDGESGMIIDFHALDDIIKECITSKYDHTTLNDFFDNPTAELMALQMSADVVKELHKRYGNKYSLSFLKLWETEKSYAMVTM